MKNPFAGQTGCPLVLDGALATELERRGHDLADPLWSAAVLLRDPAAIRAVHDDYLAAGAQVITTASYQASLPGLAARGILPAEARQLLQGSVMLAREARDAYMARVHSLQAPWVAASVGPYGAYLANGAEYRGDYGIDRDALREFHGQRMQWLWAAGPDLLACETIPSLDEALVLAELMSALSPAVTGWVSFSCRDDRHISDGTPLRQAVAALGAFPQIVAVGVNCCQPDWVASLLHEAAAAGTGKPLLAYPNAGEHYDTARGCWHGQVEPAMLVRHAADWLAAGACAIGGCCRTTPADIRGLSEWLRAGQGAGISGP